LSCRSRFHLRPIHGETQKEDDGDRGPFEGPRTDHRPTQVRLNLW